MAAFFCLASAFIFARSTPVKGLSEYTLDNGLKVFVVENHTVPLVYIEIAVRSGAVDQTPQSAGLFHLYEHMMFKGNALYKDAAAVKKAMSDLGVAQWNGTTGIDRVNYFFTVPSDRLEEGMAFWNAAIRFPLMDKTEFENEKKVVLAEIEGSQAESSSKFFNYYISNFFKDAPYRCDAGGSFDAVRNATVEQLLAIKNQYYVPSNAALFIGGDVKPEEVKKLAEKIFGSWTNGQSVKKELPPQQDVNPFSQLKKVVMSYDSLSPQLVQYQLSFRGPDTDYEIEDTYAADYLINLLEKPSGTFVQSLVDDQSLGLPGPEYASASYQTNRACGNFSYSMVAYTPESVIASNAEHFTELVRDKIIPSIYSDKSLYTKAQVKEIAENLEDSMLLNKETPEGILRNLSFWWSSASADYFYDYSKNLQKVTMSQVQDFIEKYFYQRNPMLVVFVNPDVYEKEKENFKKAGFETADGDSCIWWKNERFTSIKDTLPEYKPVNEEVYIPSKGDSVEKKLEGQKISVKTLDNGIPVYFVENKSSSCVSLNMAIKGGVAHLDRSTSGLEEALLSMLTASSTGYSSYDRTMLAYKTKASISSSTYMSGSLISMNCLAKYFDDVFKVYADGILNPDFNEEEYKKLYTGYEYSIHQDKVEPVNILYKKISDTMFAGHPYDTRSSVADFSLENITIENMKKLYSEIIRADNIFFLVNGDVKEKKVLKELNRLFASLEGSGTIDVPANDVEPLKIQKEEKMVIASENAKGTAYVARVFVSPASDNADFAAASLASSVYNDQLFNSVRIARSVCYTPSTFITSSKAPFGMEFLFKVSDFKGFKKALEEARNYMAEGKVITGTDSQGAYITLSLDEVLESYKNKFINSTFYEKQTPSAVSQNYVYNILQFNDPEHDIELVESVRKLTSEEVQAAFKKYWTEGRASWFVVCDPAEEKTVKSVLGAK